MTDSLAFEMLNVLHSDAVRGGNRAIFAEDVERLRDRRPEVYDESAHFYLSWCVGDALAEGRQEDVSPLARELATRAGPHFDTFRRSLDALAYHGQLSAIVDALRTAWPSEKLSKNVFSWAISNFAGTGADYEIYDYLERSATPEPTDPALLERIKFYADEPEEGAVRTFVGDVMGTTGREWRAEDFTLIPPPPRRRDEWDDDPEEDVVPDPGAMNLARLISEFIGYLRREEGVPFPRGELVRQELYSYFMRRHAGELNPRLSMLEQALDPKRKLPKPPRPVHHLCPERVTFEVHLSGMMSMMNSHYHSAAALFQAMPAWLRFLESRRLIDAGTHRTVVSDLLPLLDPLLQLWEKYIDDPTLYRQGQAWKADAEKGLPEFAT